MQYPHELRAVWPLRDSLMSLGPSGSEIEHRVEDVASAIAMYTRNSSMYGSKRDASYPSIPYSLMPSDPSHDHE